MLFHNSDVKVSATPHLAAPAPQLLPSTIALDEVYIHPPHLLYQRQRPHSRRETPFSYFLAIRLAMRPRCSTRGSGYGSIGDIRDTGTRYQLSHAHV